MKSKVKVYSLSVLALTLLLTILRTICLLTSYEQNVGYFRDSLIVTLTQVLYAVSALWCLSPLLFIPKNSVEGISSHHPICLSAAFVTGLTFFVSGIVILFSNSLLMLFTGTVMSLSAFFFLSELSSTRKIAAARGWLGFFVPAALLLILFGIYFNMSVALNSPFKIALQLSLLSGLAFMLCEIRDQIGISMPRAGLVSRLLCLLTCFPTGVSHFIFTFSGKCDVLAKTVATPLYSIPLLTLALYAGSRLILYRNVEENAKKVEETLDNSEEM